MIDLGIFFEKSISYGRIKFHKKTVKYNFFVYLRKFSRLRVQFCSTALVIDTFLIDLLIEISFLSKKKYISRSFFTQFLRPKLLISCLSISIMANTYVQRPNKIPALNMQNNSWRAIKIFIFPIFKLYRKI